MNFDYTIFLVLFGYWFEVTLHTNFLCILLGTLQPGYVKHSNETQTDCYSYGLYADHGLQEMFLDICFYMSNVCFD